jgi:hypothetical protein
MLISDSKAKPTPESTSIDLATTLKSGVHETIVAKATSRLEYESVLKCVFTDPPNG